MGGPDWPGGRAEQGSGEGLCLEEGRGGGVVRGVVRAVCERVADGGGRRCRHRRQVSGYDLGGEGLARPLLPQGQVYLEEEETRAETKLTNHDSHVSLFTC